MYCLEVIKSESFQSPARVRDNHNRDCSCVKSRGGYVCHSAAQRSTFFACSVEHAETYHLIDCARSNQVALNAAIESIALGYSVPAAWRAVILAYHGPRIPGLKIRGGDKAKHAPVDITVEIPCKGGVDVMSFRHFWQAFNARALVGKGGAL